MSYWILKNNGSLVISIPDKRFTFDRDRKLTDEWELFDRFQNKARDPKKKIIYRNFSTTSKSKGLENFKRKKSFLKECIERRAHLNVWDSTTFKKFLMRTLKFIEV